MSGLRKTVRVVVLFVGVAVAANAATVWALPWIVNRVVMHKITGRVLASGHAEADSTDAATRDHARLIVARGGVNVAVHVKPVTAASRAVVRPSPDLLYSACVFDLSQHPLRIHAVASSGYVSVSGFGADTGNFFVRDVGAVAPGGAGRSLDLIIVHGPVPAGLPAGVPVVQAPSTRGLVLWRTLITDPATVDHLRTTVQLQQSCTPVKTS